MKNKTFSYSKSIDRIEQIVENLERQDYDLDKIFEEVKEATDLIQNCKEALKSNEDRLNTLFEEKNT